MDLKKMIKVPGRKPVVDPNVVFKTLNIHKENIISKAGNLQPISSDIWKTISSSLENKITPSTLYISVYHNRHSWLSKLRQNMGLDLKSDEIKSISDISSDTSEYSIKSSDTKDRHFKFSISYKNFLKIKPKEKEYKDKNKLRAYSVLNPGWTDIINDKFFKKFRLPCNFIFKRSKVARDQSTSSAVKYIQFWAKCKDCLAILTGWCNRKPKPGKSLKIDILTKDTKKNALEHKTKRPLKGFKRQKIGKQLSSNLAFNWRREYASNSMKFGESSPPNLYTNEVLRKTKQEFKDKDLGITKKCPITSLVEFKRNSQYSNSIHTIGIDPIVVHYWTNHQIIIYKDYARKYCRLAIDATGSVVKKVKRSSLNELSGALFLYEAVINTGNGQISVSQMVSERHDTLTIFYWLGQWMKLAMCIPNEVTCDYSKALLGAISRAFCGISLQSYLEKCFNALTDRHSKLPPTYIRIDVAHMIKIFCRTRCLVGQKRHLLKEFYVRCLRLLLTSKDLNTFSRFLDTLLTVILSETDGESDGVKTPSEVSRSFLLDSIKGLNEELIDESEYDPVDINNYFDDITQDEEVPSINTYLNNILNLSKSKAQVKGDRISAYYLPELVPHVLRWCKDFPLWTSVMQIKFKSPFDIGTSAIVESDFNTLKHQILRFEKNPMSIDRFIVKHLKSIDGSIKIMRSCQLKDMKFNQKQCDESSSVNKNQISGDESTPTILEDNKSKNTCFYDSSDTEFPKINDNHQIFFEIPLENSSNKSSDDECMSGHKNESKRAYDSSSDEGSQHSIIRFNKKTKNVFSDDSLASSSSINSHTSTQSFLANKNQISGDESTPTILEDNKSKNTCFYDSSDTEFPKINDNHQIFFEIPLENSSNKSSDDECMSGHKNESKRAYDSSSDEGSQHSIIRFNKKTKNVFSDDSLASSSSTNSHTSTQSFLAQENWRGLGGDPHFEVDSTVDHIKKKKRPTKYMENVPEIERILTNYNLRSNLNTILRNGNSCTPLKLSKVRYLIQNTCPFDSVAVMIVMAYCDNPSYKQFINKSTNTFAEFCRELANKGPSSKMYKQRADILKNIFKASTGITGVSIIDATCNVTYIISKLLNDIPSVTENQICSQKKCLNYTNVFYNPTIITQFTDGFSALEENLQSYLSPPNFNCTSLNCDGDVNIKRKFNCHIFIETDVFADEKTFLLSDFPSRLHIQDSSYHLNGIIGYSGGPGGGHYTAFVKRGNKWENHNDMAKKISRINTLKIKITPHLIMYTKD